MLLWEWRGRRWRKLLHCTLLSRGSLLAEKFSKGGGGEVSVGNEGRLVGYLVAEKAGIALNSFRPQGQRVAVHKVVDRGGPSATGAEGIQITPRSLGGLVRGNDLFIVDEKYYIAIREFTAQPAVSSGRTPVLCPKGRWLGGAQAQDSAPAVWMELDDGGAMPVCIE